MLSLLPRKGKHMAASLQSRARRLWQTLGSVRTGIIVLIAVVIVSAAGTIILQRPLTDPDDLQRAYSPGMLHFLDRFGLTDVFHAWWFAALLALLSLTIVLDSIQRFPSAWRFFSRPYRRTDSHFRSVNPVQKQIPIRDAGQRLEAAARERPRGNFALRREKPPLRTRRLHRPCQPVADLHRRHRRRHLRLQ